MSALDLLPCLQKDIETLSGLVPTQERDLPGLTTGFHAHRGHVEPVGNDSDLEAALWEDLGGGMTDRRHDAGVPQQPAQEGAGQAISETTDPTGGGVKCGDHRGPGMGGEQRRQWHERLVDMKQI